MGGMTRARSRTTRRAGVAAAAVTAGLVGGLVLAPAVATAATSDRSTAEAATERVQRLKDALQGLVDDGTLDEEQRDAVASRLAEQLPPRGHGHGHGHGHGLGHGHGDGHGHGHGKVHGNGLGGGPALDAAAGVLGLSAEELRAELRGGRSLADVAAERGVDVDDVEQAIVDAAEQRLDEAVADGRLTQEQADERRARLPELAAEAVEREGLPGHGRKGPKGPKGPDRPAQEPDAGTEPSSYTA